MSRPALLSMGFRPLFPLAALWAVIAMALWIAYWVGWMDWPGPFAPRDWHLRELLFGYGSAALGGFLLTAIPNWTGRTPLAGAPLAWLVLVWLTARLTGLLPLPMLVPLGLNWIFIAMLLLWAARAILAADNRRNLPVLGMVVLFLASDIASGIEALQGTGFDAGGRMGVAVLILLISLIGGRIIPAFTRNWLKAKGGTVFPVEFGMFDKAVLIVTALTLALWVGLPRSGVTGGFAVLAGAMQLARLARWQAPRTFREPLLLALPLAYLFVPVGFALLGMAALWPGLVPEMAGLHAWTTGAVGGMTITVMARAVLGHSGLPLTAGPVEILFLALVLLAALLRVLAAFPALPPMLLHVSALCWMAGFALFFLRFLPVVLRPRPSTV